MKAGLYSISILCFSFCCIACTNNGPSDSKLEKDICVTDPQNPLCMPSDPQEPLP